MADTNGSTKQFVQEACKDTNSRFFRYQMLGCSTTCSKPAHSTGNNVVGRLKFHNLLEFRNLPTIPLAHREVRNATRQSEENGSDITK